MAGQEIEGDLWDQSLGLDLIPPCYRVRWLQDPVPVSLASVQILGSRDPHLTKLALDQASRSCKLNHVSKGCFTQDMIKLSLGWVTRSV